jgi:hypothetical protein
MADRGPSVYHPSQTAFDRRRRVLAVALGSLLLFGLGLLVGALLFGGGGSQKPSAERRDGAVEPPAGPGPRAIVNGVPIRYARTREGAIAAATQYVDVLSGSAVLDNRRVQGILNLVVLPRALPALAAAYRDGVALTRRKLGLQGRVRPTVVFRSNPLGYRVDRYSDAAATVEVWTADLVGSSAAAAPQQSWNTTTVALRWASGDWKVERVKTTSGPTPFVNAAPSPAPQLFSVIPKFDEYRYAPRP